VPIDAKIATATADGMVVLFVGLLLDTKSGPHTAATATAIHIATIASDAHISVTKNRVQCSSLVTCVGACGMVDISTSFLGSDARTSRPRAHP
jgi:hypothetical protein